MSPSGSEAQSDEKNQTSSAKPSSSFMVTATKDMFSNSPTYKLHTGKMTPV